MTFRPFYALAALGMFVIEVLIALYVRDGFVRPYLGDTFVVILMYLALRAVMRIRVLPATLLVLAIAFAVEFGQLYHLVDRLGLGGNAIARVVIGTGFEVRDLFAYTAGAVIILIVEAARREKL